MAHTKGIWYWWPVNCHLLTGGPHEGNRWPRHFSPGTRAAPRDRIACAQRPLAPPLAPAEGRPSARSPPDANEVRAQDVDSTYVLAQRYKAAWTAVASSCERGGGRGGGERERFIRTTMSMTGASRAQPGDRPCLPYAVVPVPTDRHSFVACQ